MEKKYYKHKIENLLVINKIITIHFLELTKNYATTTESHDFWELVCAEKGNIIYFELFPYNNDTEANGNYIIEITEYSNWQIKFNIKSLKNVENITSGCMLI